MSVSSDSRPTSLSDLTWLKVIGNAVVDLLFPPRCVGCHRFGAWFCDGCQDQVERIYPPVCPRCGRPYEAQSTPGLVAEPSDALICHRCQSCPSQLDGLLACAYHTHPLSRAVHQFKYQGMRILAAPLGQMMAESWTAHGMQSRDVDFVIPVPLHVSRERERGYNQAALLARELATYLGKPVVEDAIVRTKRTRPQVGLDIQDRKANVHDAFRCVNAGLAGRRVLLIDDVCTTGSTLEAACTALRAGGASSVRAYVLARAR